MAYVLCVMGESGSGKTTSLETLDPKTTFIINSDKKALPFKRSVREQYSVDNHNYYATDMQTVVLSILRKVDTQDNMKHIKTVVVDTINGIMVADEARRRKEKNYDKWADLAWAVYDIIDYALTMRDDLTVIFIAHVQLDRDDDGYKFAHIKTSGKKLDKISVESMFSTVLLCRCKDAEKGEYVFETQANNSTAKSPMGAFDEVEIPNDIQLVLKGLEDY